MSAKVRYTDAVPTERGQRILANQSAIWRGVHYALSFYDVLNNQTDALVFSQIMYWHKPDDEGYSKLRRRCTKGFFWIAKNHSDWYRETRCKMRTVQRSLERLAGYGLIYYELHGEKGNVTPWIRINWAEYDRLMAIWLDREIAGFNDKPPKDEAIDPYGSYYPLPESYYIDNVTHWSKSHPPLDNLTSPHDKLSSPPSQNGIFQYRDYPSDYLREFSSADAEPQEGEEITEQEGSLVSGKESTEQDGNESLPDYEKRPWLYARDSVTDDCFSGLNKVDQNTAIFNAVCYHIFGFTQSPHDHPRASLEGKSASQIKKSIPDITPVRIQRAFEHYRATNKYADKLTDRNKMISIILSYERDAARQSETILEELPLLGGA